MARRARGWPMMSSTSGRSSVVLNFNADGWHTRRSFEMGSGLVGMFPLARNRVSTDRSERGLKRETRFLQWIKIALRAISKGDNFNEQFAMTIDQ